MVVEHSYVAKMDPSSVIESAATLLSQAGYEVVKNPGASLLMAFKGKKKVGKARRLDQLPQQVCVSSDGRKISLGIGVAEKGKLDPVFEKFAVEFSLLIQSVHSLVTTPEEAQASATALWEPVLRRARQIQIRNWVLLAVVLAIPVIAVILLIVLG